MNFFRFGSVGQGLFYVGSLMHDTFCFVYDCGTESKKEYVDRQIEKYVASRGGAKSEKPVIDFVVISHLHKDHFSGLYHLLQKTEVKKIYLPYLGEDKEVVRATLALAVSDGDGVYFEEDIHFRLFCELYKVTDGNEYKGDTETVFVKGGNVRYEARDGSYAIKMFTAGNGAAPYWQFCLVERGIGSDRLNKLREELAELLCGQDVIEYIKGSAENLRKVKKAYENVFGEGNALNFTSIVLLHYPLYRYAEALLFRDGCGDCSEADCETDYPWWKYIRESHDCHYATSPHTATLLTGDAMLDYAMADAIRAMLRDKNILLLQVPHHGSKANWDRCVANGITADRYVIPFGFGNRHRLPSCETIDDMTDRNLNYFTVTQKQSYFYMID